MLGATEFLPPEYSDPGRGKLSHTVGPKGGEFNYDVPVALPDKPSANKATDKDNKGNPIVDPRTADRGTYTNFCNCFCVDPTKITIK